VAVAETDLRRALVTAGRDLYRQGMMPGACGNLSTRLDSQRVLITPSGAAKGRLRPGDLLVIDLEGWVLGGEGRPSTETPLHLALYRRFSGVAAVVHAHPVKATALAVAHRPIPVEALPEALFALGSVPLIPYGPSGDAAYADQAAAAFEQADAALLLNHGALAIGRSVAAAQGKMEVLESAAAMALETDQLGGAVALPEHEVDRLRALWRHRRGESAGHL
jgi:L-fuculose-phosphate aldolase